jgi:DNA transposition AAA+ family ATPase
LVETQKGEWNVAEEGREIEDQETVEVAGTPEPGKTAETSEARSSWPFGGDAVTEATAKFAEKDRMMIRWLFHYCVDNGISMKDAGEKIGYSNTTIYRICRGEYGANVAEITAAIARWKRVCDQRAEIKAVSFVETATVKKIWQICEAANIYRSVAVIYGDSQIGKTWALQEFALRHNHGQTRYIRLPAAAGVQMMVRSFAHACGISPKSSFEQLRERVIRATDENTLWLIDELHQCFNTYQKHSRLACLELIRELHDLTQCGMVLCGTNIAREEMENGEHKELLAQLRRRGIFRLQLPQFATWADRMAIAKHFGIKESPEGAVRELVDDVIRRNGLKAYTSFLQAASRIAAKRKVAMEWKHFATAHDVIARLSIGGNEEE